MRHLRRCRSQKHLQAQEGFRQIHGWENSGVHIKGVWNLERKTYAKGQPHLAIRLSTYYVQSTIPGSEDSREQETKSRPLWSFLPTLRTWHFGGSLPCAVIKGHAHVDSHHAQLQKQLALVLEICAQSLKKFLTLANWKRNKLTEVDSTFWEHPWLSGLMEEPGNSELAPSNPEMSPCP